jgi:hypothetical protein
MRSLFLLTAAPWRNIHKINSFKSSPCSVDQCALQSCNAADENPHVDDASVTESGNHSAARNSDAIDELTLPIDDVVHRAIVVRLARAFDT